jgi:hypothetical protein
MITLICSSWENMENKFRIRASTAVLVYNSFEAIEKYLCESDIKLLSIFNGQV